MSVARVLRAGVVRAGASVLVAAIVGCAAGEPARAPSARMGCPAVEPGAAAFLVHGARVTDGERRLDPADVLVAGGIVVEVGADICFHAQPGTVALVDARGGTLRATTSDARIVPGSPADLVLVDDATGAPRLTWKAGRRVE